MCNFEIEILHEHFCILPFTLILEFELSVSLNILPKHDFNDRIVSNLPGVPSFEKHFSNYYCSFRLFPCLLFKIIHEPEREHGCVPKCV